MLSSLPEPFKSKLSVNFGGHLIHNVNHPICMLTSSPKLTQSNLEFCVFTCQPALQEELGIKNHGTVELAWTILGINRASGVLKPQGKIWNHHRFHSDQGCKKTIPGAGSCPSANPPGQSGTKWTQDKQLGSFSKHFFYCNNSSINFRLQDSELQALCGTRSRLKSQDLLCTTGITASIRHIILTIKYCRSIPAPQWSCSSFASHHPTPIPLEPVNLKLRHIFQEHAKQRSS